MATDSQQQPQGAHLVGSVPLSSAEEVFRTASGILGEYLRRIPDGETGPRHSWMGWLEPVMVSQSQFEPVAPDPTEYASKQRIRIRSGVSPDALELGPIGYASVAHESYAVFRRLKEQGIIPAHCRFQVSIPTALAPVQTFVVFEDRLASEPAFERRWLAELDQIAAEIPHDELAIQWDTCLEFGLLEGVFASYFSPVREGIIERLVRLGAHVPEDVPFGYHLCYGDSSHKHFVQPRDTSKLCEIANAICANVKRPVNWIHMPVPRDRDDEGYFAPLRNLALHPETELYLGLVHYTDGAEGTRRRIQAALTVTPTFGVATECGMGRRPPQTIPDLMAIHAAVAAPLAGNETGA